MSNGYYALNLCKTQKCAHKHRRHSRKLILNIVKEKFFISIAFSKLAFLHITDLVCGVIIIHVFRHRKGCFHCYACKIFTTLKRLLKWSIGLEFTSGIISFSDNPSNFWVFLVRCWINTLNSPKNYFLPNAWR